MYYFKGFFDLWQFGVRNVGYIRQEVTNCCVNKLKNSLKMLLELELMLKSGVDEKLALQTQIIKLCS